MARLRSRMGLVLVLLFLGTTGLRAGPSPPATPADAAAALAARIDQHVAAGYAVRRAVPADPADDAEFVRRVYLDIAGRIPHFPEVRDFLADRSPDRRRRLVEKLLAGPLYVSHFSHVWEALLLPQSNQQARFFRQQMEPWLRTRLRDNVPYDRMVRDLLTASAVFGPGRPADRGAAAFYQANEIKPENVAAATSRLFLGVKLECAQCHDHPFASWKRKQFWEYTAFFGGLRPQTFAANRFTPPQDDPSRHEITIPGTEKVVQARFLDGSEPKWKEKANARATLAEWMTSPDNPYFARAAVNRLWAHFFGVGLIDPVDDLGTENRPSHPELLDELARSFVAHKYDLKFLVRAVTASKTYQLSSRLGHPSQQEVRAFARMNLKGLTAEQVFDSLAVATGYSEAPNPPQPGFNRVGTPRARFLATFANASDKPTEHQTSILQALALMNGTFVADATSLTKSRALGGILDAPFMDDRQRLDTLFLMALSRPMRPNEEARLVSYVTRGGPSGDSRQALADVFWALLNSSEFILNH